jgi:hypothetical protein
VIPMMRRNVVAVLNVLAGGGIALSLDTFELVPSLDHEIDEKAKPSVCRTSPTRCLQAASSGQRSSSELLHANRNLACCHGSAVDERSRDGGGRRAELACLLYPEPADDASDQTAPPTFAIRRLFGSRRTYEASYMQTGGSRKFKLVVCLANKWGLWYGGVSAHLQLRSRLLTSSDRCSRS